MTEVSFKFWSKSNNDKMIEIELQQEGSYTGDGLGSKVFYSCSSLHRHLVDICHSVRYLFGNM